MSDEVLFIGNQDAFSRSISARLSAAEVRVLFIDEVAMAGIHLCSNEPKTFPRICTESLDVDFRSSKAVITNHFLVPTAVRSINHELFWSEWTALFGHLLSGHSNVFNPPRMGSWCGPFPTVFAQISILQDALRAESISFPSPISLAAAMWGKGGLRDLDLTALFSALPVFQVDQFDRSSGMAEIVAPFVDEFVVYPEQHYRLAKRLRSIAREFQRLTGCRIGQLRLFTDNKSIAFHSASGRPNPAQCLPEVWTAFSNKLVDRILHQRAAG